MANVPDLTCDALKVNLQLAGIQGFSGSAKRHGALRAAVDFTQDNTIQNLDPRQCANKISIKQAPTVGNGQRTKYGVDIVWEKPDCTDYTDDCGDFTCTDGELATPTTQTSEFIINECEKLNINIPKKDWNNTCCGVEEYYTQVLQARATGATASQLQGMVNRLAERTYNRRYENMLVAEKLQKQLHGKLDSVDTLVLTKLGLGKGYNFVADAYTGAPVGNAIWEVPALEMSEAGFTDKYYRDIDPDALRRELARFIAQHPNCGSGITLIGGASFRQMFETLDIRCCDSTGINQAQSIQKVLGLLANYYEDDLIDTVYPKGTFFIVENNSLALFWLAKQTNPDYRKEKVAGISGIYREFSTLSIPVSDCRDSGMLFTFDSFLTAKLDNCLADVNFNLQLRAEYDLFTMPAVGCVNPRTGIYQGLLVNKKKVLTPTPVPTPV